MLLIIGVGIVFTIYNARQSVEEEIQSSVSLALRAVEVGRSDPVSKQDPLNYWRLRLEASEKTRHLNIRIISADGESVSLSKERPNQSVTKPPAWFIWWIRPEPLKRKQPIESDKGSMTLIIEDDPNDEIIEAWREARSTFTLILLQAFLIGSLVQIILGRALRSIPIILKGLEDFEAGNFENRMPDFSIPEFSRISGAFNHAASALQKANQENHKLVRRTLTVQEEERRLLAGELHDELGQSITGIKVTAISISKDNPDTQPTVETIVATCDHLFSVLRSMIRRLRPNMLEELGLAASLEDMIQIWREQNRDITVRLDFDDAIETCTDTQKIQLFRIVQECLSNIARHSGANKADIRTKIVTRENEVDSPRRFDSSDLYVCVTVSDNGQGFNPETIRPGFGLLGIRERAESLGGIFCLRTRPNQGVLITVEIPCAEPSLSS